MHPAGWYADPVHPQLLRWFDGHRWTEHTAPAPRARRTSRGLVVAVVVTVLVIAIGVVAVAGTLLVGHVGGILEGVVCGETPRMCD